MATQKKPTEPVEVSKKTKLFSTAALFEFFMGVSTFLSAK